jgi:arsenical pump membrane protein
VLTGGWAEAVPLLALVGVLVFAMAQPGDLPEATLAVPAAALLVGLGVVTPAAAWRQVVLLGPTVGFLAAVLVLAHLADAEGVFSWLGARLANASRGRPRRLLALVFFAASVTTAVLSLDATVVLLTPVVFATAVRLPARPKPHVYACSHLANSASTLLPVSNLTNLLAFAASGLSFARFAALMGLPWVVAVVAEFAVFARFFRVDLTGQAHAAGTGPDLPAPTFAFLVLAVTLAGFGVSGLFGIEPVWVAVAGALVLAGRAFVRRTIALATVARAASPLFCLFVFALGVVVAAVSAHGLGQGLARILPATPTLPNLLWVAVLAAALANLVNNLPATLVMLAALGGIGCGARPGLILAMLIGVNIGPNLTYVGSLATLLWRRVLAGENAAPTLTEFLRLGALTVPLCLVASTVTLWLSLRLGFG